MNTMLESMGSGVVALPEESNRAEAAKLAKEMARIGREGSSLVVSCDGPLGPYRVAKPGVLIVGRESGPPDPAMGGGHPAGVPAEPVGQDLVPLPFCRMRVYEGAELEVGERAASRAWPSCRPPWTGCRPSRIGPRGRSTTPAAVAAGVLCSGDSLPEERRLPAIGDVAGALARRHQPGLPPVAQIVLA